MSERFYFRQGLAGRDFAVGDEIATSMRNFTYAFGDRESGDAILVDPAYRPDELVQMVNADDMSVKGVIATHYHPDHVGGTLMAQQHIAGVAELREIVEVPIHVQAEELEWITARTGLNEAAFTVHHHRDVLHVGDVQATLLHTPGHTPGSQCVHVQSRLLSGDTLFIDGCGRTDLPGGDPLEMHRSLSERLAEIEDDTELFPGHLYSPEPSLSMGQVRKRNYVLAPRSSEQWLAAFGS